MSRSEEKIKFCTTVEKDLFLRFKELFCRSKGDLATHLENAMRLYIQYLTQGGMPPAQNHSEHTHIKDSNISFSSDPPGKSDELMSIVGELSNMVTVGGRLGKPLIMQVISRATGLRDRRSIASRILLLQSCGIIRPDPNMKDVYEVIFLPSHFGKSFK
ncbi:MAG: hypothetical protein QXI05_05665 [Candidatus Bathyarchaeia archaeon]